MQSTEAGYEFHASSTSICKIEFFFLETHPMIRKLLIGLPERDRETRSNTRHCSRLTSSLYCTAILPLKANMQCRVGLLLQFLLVSVNASSASLHASFPVGGACSPAHAPCRCCLLMLSVWNKSSPEVLQIQGRNADTRLFLDKMQTLDLLMELT